MDEGSGYKKGALPVHGRSSQKAKKCEYCKVVFHVIEDLFWQNCQKQNYKKNDINKKK